MLWTKPIRLRSNRVRRTYRGGRLLGQFRALDDPKDDWYPEDWVGSVVASRLDPEGREGLSLLGEDGAMTLDEALRKWPVEFLGEGHVQKFGAHPAVLVKLLDASVRLGIQAHPDRRTAARLFGSSYGKTESWIVLETRTIDGVAPSILLGFKEGVTPDAFERAVRAGDIAQMEDLLHRFEVRPGDVYWVEVGTPHAIGSGVFMVEVQEPADLTIYCEPGGEKIDAMNAHLGLSWRDAAQAFSAVGRSRDEALDRWRRQPSVLWEREGAGRLEALLDGPVLKEYFRAYRLHVEGRVHVNVRAFSLVIVTQGAGMLSGPTFSQGVHRGDTLLLPAGLGDVVAECELGAGSPPLEMITCHPPAIDAASSELPIEPSSLR